MKRIGFSALIMSWLIAVMGCASLARKADRPPKLKAEELQTSRLKVGSEAIGNLVEFRTRIKDVEYRISTNSAHQCGKYVRPRIGAIFSSRKSFEHKALQEVAQRDYALGERMTVAYVVPRGPLDRAQLKRGDEILEVDGAVFRTANDFGRFLLESADRTSLRIRYRRGDVEREQLVQLVPACPVEFGIAASPMIVAWQNFRLLVAVPIGLLRCVESDGELAVALSHQFAHALFDLDDDTLEAREMRADREGLLIAARAGYDVSSAPQYWEKVAREYPWLIEKQSGIRRLPWIAYDEFPHHGISTRMHAIRATVRAIEASRASRRVESTSVPESSNPN